MVVIGQPIKVGTRRVTIAVSGSFCHKIISMMQTPKKTPVKRKLKFPDTPAPKQPCPEAYEPASDAEIAICERLDFLRSAIYAEQCPKLLAFLQTELQDLAQKAARTLQTSPNEEVKVQKIADESYIKALPTKKQELIALLVEWLYHEREGLDVQIPCHFSCIRLIGSLVPQQYVKAPELALSGVQNLLKDLNHAFTKPVNSDSSTADKAAFANHVVGVVFKF